MLVIEVANSATSTMTSKATDNDVAHFQSYTKRNLDKKCTTDSDIEPYNMMNVKEDALSNRQAYLDVMCFPTLFPTGEFGDHPRTAKISPSEYVKSRLMNKHSRFRKCPEYIFYLLWQKERREISAGVHDVLKSTKQQPMPVSSVLEKVNTCKHLESNLCTMLQSVRGSKYYWWFVRLKLDV